MRKANVSAVSFWAGMLLAIGAHHGSDATAQTASSATRPESSTRQSLEPAVDTSRAEAAAAAPPAAVRRPPGPAARVAEGGRPVIDRVDLEASQITGNRELPKVLYIVPWKRSDLGDLAGKPVNSLLDEVLAPVDRDVFRRETRYFETLQSAPAPGGASAAGSPADSEARARSQSSDSVRNPSQPSGAGRN